MYLATVTDAARQRPCLLCGSRHEPRIHAWCGLLVRCVDGRNHSSDRFSGVCTALRVYRSASPAITIRLSEQRQVRGVAARRWTGAVR